MPRAKHLSSKTTDLGEFNFLKCTTLLIPVPIWVRFMAINMQKVALLEVFRGNSLRNSLTCLTDLQSYKEFECRYCDTTRFHKNRPQKVSPLISFQSVLNLSASVDGPFSQVQPTTTWCRRSMHRKSNGRANGSTTLYTTHNAEPRCMETQSQEITLRTGGG